MQSRHKIVVARTTEEYRDAAVNNLDYPDICLEIGCHEGMTTLLISNRTTFVAGVDINERALARAKARHGQLHFYQVDGFEVDQTKSLSPTGTFDRILIDISGKAGLVPICRMVLCQRAAFPDAQLIVKNEELYDALADLQQGRGDGAELEGLLGQSHLAECEVFVHGTTPRGSKPFQALKKKAERQASSQSEEGLDSRGGGSPDW